MSESMPAAAPEDPAKDFETLLLNALRLTSLVSRSTILAEEGLSLPSFSLLVAAADQPGGAQHTLARKASLESRAAQRTAREELAKAGLIDVTVGEGGKRMLAPTEKGVEVLAAVREKFAGVATTAEVKSWKAVPRIASIVRSVRPLLPAAPEAPETKPEPKQAAKKGGGKRAQAA